MKRDVIELLPEIKEEEEEEEAEACGYEICSSAPAVV